MVQPEVLHRGTQAELFKQQQKQLTTCSVTTTCARHPQPPPGIEVPSYGHSLVHDGPSNSCSHQS